MASMIYDPQDPTVYFDIGEAVAAIALILAFMALSKPITRFRLYVGWFRQSDAYWIFFISILFVFVAAAIPFLRVADLGVAKVRGKQRQSLFGVDTGAIPVGQGSDRERMSQIMQPWTVTVGGFAQPDPPRYLDEGGAHSKRGETHTALRDEEAIGAPNRHRLVATTCIGLQLA